MIENLKNLRCADCGYVNQDRYFCVKCGFNLVNEFIINEKLKKRNKNEQKVISELSVGGSKHE